MSLQIDPKSPIPIYYQIREQLRRQITSGELLPGDALPTEMEICAECNVSRMTARQALTQLSNEGLVNRQRGKGTFVAAPKATLESSEFPLKGYTELLGMVGVQAGAIILAKTNEPATKEVASNLEILPGDEVVCISRKRLMNGETMSLETSYIPHKYCPDLTKLTLEDQSIYRLLRDRYGISLDYATDTIELSVAGPFEAKELKIREGVPVVQVTRLSYLSDHTPIEFTQTIHRGDRFKSVVRRSHLQLN